MIIQFGVLDHQVVAVVLLRIALRGSVAVLVIALTVDASDRSGTDCRRRANPFKNRFELDTSTGQGQKETPWS